MFGIVKSPPKDRSVFRIVQLLYFKEQSYSILNTESHALGRGIWMCWFYASTWETLANDRICFKRSKIGCYARRINSYIDFDGFSPTGLRKFLCKSLGFQHSTLLRSFMVARINELVRTRVQGKLLSDSCFQGYACGHHVGASKK